MQVLGLKTGRSTKALKESRGTRTRAIIGMNDGTCPLTEGVKGHGLSLTCSGVDAQKLILIRL